MGSVVLCFKAWLCVTSCSWIRCKHGRCVTLNASLGSWREGKLDLRDAPLFQHNAAVQWFWDGQRKAARVGVRAKETKTGLTAQTRKRQTCNHAGMVCSKGAVHGTKTRNYGPFTQTKPLCCALQITLPHWRLMEVDNCIENQLHSWWDTISRYFSL